MAKSKRAVKVETNPIKIEGARIGYDRARSRAALVDLRWRLGFQWRGGFVGGNPRYRRSPLCYKGLVSREHAIFKLFVSKLPRARSLQTGYNKRLLDGTDSKLLACDCDYVESNKAMRGVLRVELDGVLDSWSAIQEMCRTAGIPLPNIAVGYADQTGKICNPHLVWLLADSVAYCGRGRRAPRRLYQGVLRGLTAAMMPWGADPGGLSNALRMKNPLCPTWDRKVFAEKPYSLEQLRPHVDIGVRVASLERRTDGARHADHPDPDVAAGSNYMFRYVAAYAYETVTAHRAAGGTLDEFAFALTAAARRTVTFPQRFSEQGLRRLAQSVAKWTWENRRVGKHSAPNPEVARINRARAAREVALERGSNTLNTLIAAARVLACDGVPVTRQALRLASGTPKETVRRHFGDVLAALSILQGGVAESLPTTDPNDQPYVKKSGNATSLLDRAHPMRLPVFHNAGRTVQFDRSIKMPRCLLGRIAARDSLILASGRGVAGVARPDNAADDRQGVASSSKATRDMPPMAPVRQTEPPFRSRLQTVAKPR